MKELGRNGEFLKHHVVVASDAAMFTATIAVETLEGVRGTVAIAQNGYRFTPESSAATGATAESLQALLMQISAEFRTRFNSRLSAALAEHVASHSDGSGEKDGDDIPTMSVAFGSMAATRPSDFYLTFYDACVFADFQRVNEGRQVQLLRISFDGYGCCDSSRNDRPFSLMDAESSGQFLATLENYRHNVENHHPQTASNPSDAITSVRERENILAILRKYFAENLANGLWQDALDQYSLL